MKALQITRSISASSGSQVIVHGLGATPSFIEIFAVCHYNIPASGRELNYHVTSYGTYDGTDHTVIYTCVDEKGLNEQLDFCSGNATNKAVYIKIAEYGDNTAVAQAATVSLDDTNITLTWTKTDTGSPTVTNDINLTIIAHS